MKKLKQAVGRRSSTSGLYISQIYAKILLNNIIYTYYYNILNADFLCDSMIDRGTPTYIIRNFSIKTQFTLYL